jgi:hypothetical protein
MRSHLGLVGMTFILMSWLFLAPGLFAQGEGVVAKWSFDEKAGRVTRDSVSGIEDKLEGFIKYVPGVSGTGMRFDGYTTSVIRDGKKAPELKDAFTVEAWIALNTYPWNLVPVVDHEMDQQVGYFFGIDALGRVTLQVALDRVWQSLTSTAQLPLKKWVHIVGTCDSSQGLAIYVDGKEAGRLAVQGTLSLLYSQLEHPEIHSDMDLLIGRVRHPMLPDPGEAIHPTYPVWYSLDGILDEVKIYDRSLSQDEVEKAYRSLSAPGGEVLSWPVLPAGPAGAGGFGAYYATLQFEDVWDRPRRIGPDSDVVVRFDQAPIRLVFWQGMNYMPAWVTENNKWYTDEALENSSSECPDGGDCEPMSDKQSRYSHVRILESSEARAVVHWRYALAEVENYEGAHPDLMGWFDWADEYWTVYPDGVAVRKSVVWTTDLSKPRLYQESIVINGPGQRPEDNINADALTLANMKGETATYTWPPKTSKTFDWPTGPRTLDKPQGANIQFVNLKSTWKPFQVVSPAHISWDVYWDEKTFFSFECWNHFPVSQIASSGRPCLAADRPSHTSLSNIWWDPFETTDNTQSKLLLDGLTTKPAGELLSLAKSWLTPASIEVAGEAFRSEGYDPAQRAFVLRRAAAGKPAVLDLTLQASHNSPVVNPAIVVKNWGEVGARLRIDGKPVAWGKDFRYGVVRKLEGTDLVVWMRKESVTPVKITLASEGQ